MADFQALADEADAAILEAFGEPIRYLPAAGASIDLTGMFFDPFEPAAGFPVDVESSSPVLFLLRSQVPDQASNDEVIIRARTFRVKQPEYDELGMLGLPLEEV